MAVALSHEGRGGDFTIIKLRRGEVKDGGLESSLTQHKRLGQRVDSSPQPYNILLGSPPPSTQCVRVCLSCVSHTQRHDQTMTTESATKIGIFQPIYNFLDMLKSSKGEQKEHCLIWLIVPILMHCGKARPSFSEHFSPENYWLCSFSLNFQNLVLVGGLKCCRTCVPSSEYKFSFLVLHPQKPFRCEY